MIKHRRHTGSNHTHLERAVVYGLARRFGMPIIVDNDYFAAKDIVWDGDVLRLPAKNTPEDITHELAHFIIAKEHGEHTRKDWGLDVNDFSNYLGATVAETRENETARLERLLDTIIETAVAEVSQIAGLEYPRRTSP